MPDRLDGFAGAVAPPRRNGELVFEAPWESRVFGLTAALVERGAFSWPDVQAALIASIAAWEADPGGGPWSYWERWRVALEALLAARGVCAADEVAARVRALAARPPGHDHR